MEKGTLKSHHEGNRVASHSLYLIALMSLRRDSATQIPYILSAQRALKTFAAVVIIITLTQTILGGDQARRMLL